MKRICSIYRSPRKAGMYLYVLKADALARVPEALLPIFGTPLHAFDLVLTPERKLAREDIVKVLENLDSQGYHLQMPPPEDEYIEHLPEELLRRNDPV
ncbi:MULTISPECIES: YcgL domain-containing protein [Pseudomonas]|uniref:YcgL domain-containing protein V7S98_03370 n=1 Tax=Pseudomonas farsensis TaxID=2745492 RepID=A0ABU8QNM2_9PSED|nr:MULTISPECIES: YcgL domain-containing protein [Pseudomonas]MBC3412946.1 YcgL domain-containing protein [Pseudomonas sp. SWRI51]MBV4533452.1 YcgL domain-containing protein [Pseudomonas farsensis]